jgi:hypothetical protein
LTTHVAIANPLISFDIVLRVVYDATMTWQIRNVPEEAHRILKHEAVDRGIPLNTLVIEILTAAAEKLQRKAVTK